MNFCMHCMEPLEDGAAFCPECGKAQSYDCPEHHLQPGTFLSGKRYLLGVALGEGGFGITYLARDTRLGMTVAIKEFYPMGYVSRNTAFSQTITATMRSRDYFEKGKRKFLDEAHLLAELNDEPGIVDVRDFFEENNTAYIVMEYLKGETLKAHLKASERLPFREAYAMLRPVMESLAAAHEKNVIHRDIAPDNIMLTKRGAKLLDFGAAREVFTTDENSLSILVKRGYSPYEQYTKKNQGPWTDVYALTAVLYRAVTGKAPEEALDRITEPDKPLPFDDAPLNDRMKAALTTGLAVTADKRYRTVGELLRALDAALAVPTPRPEAPKPAVPVKSDEPTLPSALPTPEPPTAPPTLPSTPPQPEEKTVPPTLPSTPQRPKRAKPVRKDAPTVVPQRPQSEPRRISEPRPQPEPRRISEPRPQPAPDRPAPVKPEPEKQPAEKKPSGTGKIAVLIVLVTVVALAIVIAVGSRNGRGDNNTAANKAAVSGENANASISDEAVTDEDGSTMAEPVSDPDTPVSDDADDAEAPTECQHLHTRDVAEKKSTCKKKGYTAGVYCDDCKTYISGHEKLPLADHTLKTVGKKTATCQEEGYTGKKVCTVCDKTIEEGKTIPKTSHTLKTINYKPATCTSSGYSGDQYCTTCKHTISTGHTTAKLGHTDSNRNGKCDRCGTWLSSGGSSSRSSSSSGTTGTTANVLEGW